MSTPASIPASFDPTDLGKHLRRQRETGLHPAGKPFVTLLVGAGFSFSAGIPVAGRIVEELEKEIADDPLLRKAAEAPCKEGISRYAHLMEALGTPKERARRIRAYVERARDPATGQLKINWAHLLLATMVKHGYVTRILTTNFDPLVVEALALIGQPIRTFDLNTTGHYDSDILENGTVVYLHGQMHSLLLANTTSETENIQQHYRGVLQEAIRDSYLIVVGYSGDCDPVLNALNNLITFPCGLWWSHYGSAGPGKGVQAIFAKHANACHLAIGDDADLFMRKLVLDGMALPRPDEIVAPFSAMERSLLRIVSPLPTAATPGTEAPEPDQVANSLALVRKAIAEASAPSPSTTPRSKKSRPTKSKKSATPAPTTPENLRDLQLVMRINEAATTENWTAFDQLAATIRPDPSSPVSQAVGDGWVRRARASLVAENLEDGTRHLESARRYGVSSNNAAWVPTLVGNALSSQATLSGNSTAADRLFAEAFAKYSEAIRIKPDMHEAFYNWGTSLLDQARLKGNSSAADRLFADASAKFAEAVRIKPDKNQALFNWGFALSQQAELKCNSHVADQLFAVASTKFAEAARAKPDDHSAFFNWGFALSQQAKFKGKSPASEGLFADASAKFAQAVRIKPDKDEAWLGWGNSLIAQARLKGNSSAADPLFAEAFAKFAEAARINPENHTAWFNLACVAALQDKLADCIAALTKWKQHKSTATRKELDGDTDFDRVREHPDFKAFRDSLPA